MPQIQFSARVLEIAVMPQGQVRTVLNCAEDSEDSTQFLGEVVDAPVV